MTDERATARAQVLEAFRWTKGHADLGAILRDATTIAMIGQALAEPFRPHQVTAVVAPEARGFVFGALAAQALGAGLVLARKPGSVHPDAATGTAHQPDWRGQIHEFRISRRALAPGDRCLIVDDWVQTGSQVAAIRSLVASLGATVVGVSTLVDDADDATRSQLGVVGLLRSDELGPSS